MANFGNPLDFFQAGQVGGQAGSPAYGIGSAIRSILDQANKKQLLNTQAEGNLATGLGVAGYKNQLAQDTAARAGEIPADAGTGFIDPATGKPLIKNYNYNKDLGRFLPKVTPATIGQWDDTSDPFGDNPLNPKGGNNPPPGVDPTDWAKATPEERDQLRQYFNQGQ